MTTWRVHRATLGLAMLAACSSPPQQAGDTPPGTKTSAEPSQPTRPSTNVAGDTTQQSSRDVELSLDRNHYAVGAQVTLTIRSHTSDTLGFNPCSRSLEREEGQTWVKYGEPMRMCTMELWLLQPNTTRSATTELPASISRGTYRMVLLFSRQKSEPSNPVRAVSAPFTLE